MNRIAMAGTEGDRAGGWQILLVERNVSVVQSGAIGPGQRVAITLDHWRDAGERRNPAPYAAKFLARRGIAHINIFAHWNHWFQVEDMEAAVAVAAAAAATADQRIVYGNSMGGFGALQFGGSLGADLVIAMAPQFSMDGRKAPLERRYNGDMARLAAYHRAASPEALPGDEFIHDSIDAVSLPSRTYILYDPGQPVDAAHVAFIERHHAIVKVPVHASNHWPDKALLKHGLLSTVIEDIIEGRLAAGAAFHCPFD
jgi:hypothetical protein